MAHREAERLDLVLGRTRGHHDLTGDRIRHDPPIVRRTHPRGVHGNRIGHHGDQAERTRLGIGIKVGDGVGVDGKVETTQVGSYSANRSAHDLFEPVQMGVVRPGPVGMIQEVV